MYNFKKTTILIFTSAILYITLSTELILPHVVLSVYDAVIVTLFVLIGCILMKLLSYQEETRLKKKIFLQNIQMQAIINNSIFIMHLKDLEGNIVLSNQFDKNLFGMTSDELIGMSSYELYKSPEIAKQEDLEVIRDKKCLIKERKVSTINKDLGWQRIIKTPVFDAQNNVVNLVAIYHDINNEKELEERKDTFIATLTHDLKTPTIAQIRALDLMLNDTFGEMNAEQKEIVQQIKNSCSYMHDLIFTILDTYLYDNGQTKIHKEKFNLLELINGTVNEISHLLIEKEQNIILKIAPDVDVVRGDPFQLKRVIVNLLANAIHYGYKKTDIVLSVEKNDEQILLNVQNEAPHITQDRLVDMYQKFKSTNNAKFNKTGTGLGLYLSKQIIEAHQGKVYVSSSEDGICNFGFTIPQKFENDLANV